LSDAEDSDDEFVGDYNDCNELPKMDTKEEAPTPSSNPSFDEDDFTFGWENGEGLPTEVPGILLGDEELGSMGWVQRAALEDMHAEYVFRTKKFSVTEERTRRERKSSLESNMESMPLDGVEATSATPTKRPESNPNTPDTVSTNSSEDDVEENESLTPDADIQSNEDESFECTICISPVDDGDQVGVTVCGHIFHSECLKQWVARKNQCPLCKAAIASPRPARSGAEEEGSATPDNPANHPVNISDEMAAAHPRRLNRFLFPNSRPTTTPSPPRPSSLSLSFSNESEPNSRSRRRRTGLIIYE
ncbi:hypothetical protein THAOC_06726, partial [Thalassiosira oceanica]